MRRWSNRPGREATRTALLEARTLHEAAARLGLTKEGLIYRLKRDEALNALADRFRHREVRWPTGAEMMAMARAATSLNALAEVVGVSRQWLYRHLDEIEDGQAIRNAVAANRAAQALGTRRVYDRRVSDPEYARIVRADPCSYCGKAGGQLDHIEPVSEGGALSDENFTGSCQRCNSRKRTTPLLLFLLKRSYGVQRVDRLPGAVAA